MLVFPQFATGAAALYPLTKQSALRTVVNTLGDGSTVVFSDPDAALTTWEIRAKGLTLAEWNAVEALFAAVAGQWQTFTFLDPAGNLLSASEDLGGGAWSNGALIALTAGVTDPLGTSRGTRVVNGGFAAESVAQTLNVPGSFRYCLSVWARTVAGSSVTLTASTTGASAALRFGLTSSWARIVLPVNLGMGTASVTFGAQLAAGASVDLFGMQVEAQVGASDYKMTGVSGGVISDARFDWDGLIVTAQSTDVFDLVVRVVSR
jgi:hypothetical protein